ncbi:hypothetical protein ACH35V_36690 [Actinomadura sp. 1N219]|uniref:hypothetical protein n=1 Tax=Actinomadura sp. 1N219 TaxID=3375152 RepID=UPI003792E978
MAEFAERYTPQQIAMWLRPLKEARAWDAHYATSRELYTATKTLHALGDTLFAQAHRLLYAWSDRASPHAQHKLRRIHATTTGLAAFTGALEVVERHTAEALEQVLGDLPPGRALVPNRDRDDRLARAFDDLTARYRDVADGYPTRLAVDLPFGGIDPPDGPVRPTVPVPPVPPPATPRPEETSEVSPPVIGGTPQYQANISINWWLPDPDPAAPPVIGLDQPPQSP